jgi:hypothetical protein
MVSSDVVPFPHFETIAAFFFFGENYTKHTNTLGRQYSDLLSQIVLHCSKRLPPFQFAMSRGPSVLLEYCEQKYLLTHYTERNRCKILLQCIAASISI